MKARLLASLAPVALLVRHGRRRRGDAEGGAGRDLQHQPADPGRARQFARGRRGRAAGAVRLAADGAVHRLGRLGATGKHAACAPGGAGRRPPCIPRPSTSTSRSRSIRAAAPWRSPPRPSSRSRPNARATPPPRARTFFSVIQSYFDVLRDQAVVELNINNEQVLRRQLEATERPVPRRLGHPHRRGPGRGAPCRRAREPAAGRGHARRRTVPISSASSAIRRRI